MEETKICPNCGKEILAVAKKCKYCGTWLEPRETMRCPICLEIIPKDVDVCPLCHERIKPVEEKEEPIHEPVQEVSAEVVSETSKSSSAPTVPTQPSNKKRIILFSSIAAVVILVVGCLVLLQPAGGIASDKTDEAEQLHSFFFNSLCEPLNSLSDDEVLNKRLSKLLSKQQLRFIEDNLSLCSPVYMKYDSDGNAVFSFYGTKNANTTPETYTVNYTDVGGHNGWFEVITLINGNRKQAKESVKKVKSTNDIEPTIRIWNYEGTIRQKTGKKDISFTLYVDGRGEHNDSVRGNYQISGEPSTVFVWGYIKGFEDKTLLLSTPGKINDFVFDFSHEKENGVVFNPTLDDALCMEGHCESRNAKVRLYRTRLLDNNPTSIIFKVYEGKLYDDKSSYPIEIHIAVETEREGNYSAVSGYYFYKSKGRENFIPIAGSHSHGNGIPSVDFLDLETISGNMEDFSFEVFGDVLEEETLTGKWTLYDETTNEIKRVLNIDLKDISGNR